MKTSASPNQPQFEGAVSGRLTFLATADTASVRAMWRQSFGFAAPPSFRRELLVRAVAYRTQANENGDVTFGSQHQGEPRKTSPSSPVQAKLIRVWRGEVYEVVTAGDGFEMNGKLYRSLSAIARDITGVRWNGLTFFGVRTKPELSRRQHRG